jgi:hypothetical protein
MKWKCYTTIIDQLCEINYNGRVALMLSNEPLLDDRLEDMIVFAKAKSQRLLNHNKSFSLINAASANPISLKTLWFTSCTTKS